MKKIYILWLLALCTNLSLFSQNIVFEDVNFKKALLNHRSLIDTNIDGEISQKEAEKFGGRLNVHNKNIKSLKGFEYFINIRGLYCYGNELTSLDVSKNTALTDLRAYNNKLTSLDVSKNTALTNLRVNSNQLTSLDVSKNTGLTDLIVSNNQLTNLDLSKNTALTKLYLIENKLSALDVSGNTALKTLNVSNNQLTALDVSKNIALTYLHVAYTSLTNLDLSKNTALKDLIVNSNKLTTLDVSKNTELINLSASGGNYTSLDLSKCKLERLYIGYCPELSSLNLIDQKLEKELYIKNNPKLNIVCTNLDKIDDIDLELKDKNNGAYKVSIDCSKETLNTLSGKVRYASNLSLCGTPNLKPFNKIKLIISALNNNVKKIIIPDVLGNYSTLVPEGEYIMKIEVDKDTYFDYSPKPDNNDPYLGLIKFTGSGQVKSKDVCVMPKANYDDLAISIVGGRARPGFNVTYAMTYKNVGTTTLSGKVKFIIKEPTKQEFVGASIVPSALTRADLSWDFKDLAPMESKTIMITLVINKPTDSPAVNGGDIFKYTTTITDANGVEKPVDLDDNTAELSQEVKNSWDPNDKTCIEGRILRPKNVGKYLTYMIRFENKGSAEATNVRVEDVIDNTKFDIKTLQYISSGRHLCMTEVEGDTVNFKFKDINLGFSPSDNKGYVLFKIKTRENLKEGDELKNKASIYFDFNKPVITETETVVVKKKVIKNLKFSDYFTLTPNPTKGPADLIEKKKGLKIKFFTINDSYGDMLAYDPGSTRRFDFWYLTKGKVYYLRVFTENNGILSTRFIKE